MSFIPYVPKTDQLDPPNLGTFKIELSTKSPCLYHVFEPPFSPYPLFWWYPQSKEILLNFSMKCQNSAFNAQGSRVITIVVQVGAVRIYVAAVEALMKMEIQDETQYTAKIDGFLSFTPCYMIFGRCFL
jgi:hypothetical protein